MKHIFIAGLCLLITSHVVAFTEPPHKGIVGLTKSDVKYALDDFREMFSQPNFKEFRKLLKRDKNSIKRIDSTELAKAMKGKNLTRDEQALLDLAVATINADDEYMVEYVKDTNGISPQAEVIFKEEINRVGDIVAIKNYYKYCNCVPGRAFGETLSGKGITTQTPTGTYTLIINSNHIKVLGRDYIVTETGKTTIDELRKTVHITAHEILGHARSLSLNCKNQHEAGVLTENLVLRLLPLKVSRLHHHIQRMGWNHGRYIDGGECVIDEYDSKLPEHIYPGK